MKILIFFAITETTRKLIKIEILASDILSAKNISYEPSVGTSYILYTYTRMFVNYVRI